VSAEKYQRMLYLDEHETTFDDNTIELNSKLYEELVIQNPKNYTIFAFLYNQDPQVCRSCWNSLQAFKKTANEYKKAYLSNVLRIFFVTLESNKFLLAVKFRRF